MDFHLWAKDTALAAREVQKHFPETVKEIIALADEICQNRFTFRGHWEMERTHLPVEFGDEIDWEHVENGDPEWAYAFSRHSFLVALGKAWRFTGDEKYKTVAARLWADWLARVPLTEAARSITWRSIETGLRCESWLRAFALFEGSGLPDAGLAAQIEESLRTHAAWLMEANGTFQKLSNWGVLQDHGLFLLGLAFGVQEWQAAATTRLGEELYHQVLADGAHWEQSPMYHCEVLHCCLDVMLAARHKNVSLPEAFTGPTHAMAKALAAMVRPDGLLLCQGDTDEVDARDLIAIAAFLFDDPALKAYAANQLYEENLWDLAGEEDAYRALPETPLPADPSTALPHSGNYMLWDGNGPQAGFLHFHCGVLGSGHGHAEQLHVNLVQNGESILCDSGRYTYTNTPLRRQLKEAAAHNCVVVDGEGFSQPLDSWAYGKIAEPLKGEYRFTPQAAYAEGAHLGYLDKGVLHRRRVLRVAKGLWVLWDEFYPAGPATGGTGNCEPEHEYSHYYHFGPTGEVALQNGQAIFTGKASTATMAFAGAPSPKVALAKAPLSREYNRLEEGALLTLRHKAAGFASVATVVATGGPGTAPQLSAEMLPVTLASQSSQLPSDKAQALSITLAGQRHTVLLCHSDTISLVDMLAADGHMGYGKVLVFGPSPAQGLCLAW